MRRQGQYPDSGANTYVAAQTQMSSQRAEHNSGHFQGRLEAFTPERENPYANSKAEAQWRWEKDRSKVTNPMGSQMFNEGADASRSYFQSHRPESKLALEMQNTEDPRSRLHEEDMNIGYQDNPAAQTFEGLEQKFLNDIIKLAKEQNDAEDAENARHREKINAINAQYEEQLAALRTRHSSRRDDLLKKESHARQQQYQQAIMNHYPNASISAGDAHGYGNMAASVGVGDAQRGYNADQFDSYRERARFLGSGRDHGFEPRGPYPGGRVYDTGSRYY